MSAQLTLGVMYSCVGCKLVDRVVQVPVRTTEDVAVWFEQVLGVALVTDHKRVSPKCKSRVMSTIKVPMSGAKIIGGAPIQ